MLGGLFYGSACAALVAVVAVVLGENNSPVWLLALSIPVFGVIFGGVPGLVVGTVVGLVRRAAQPRPLPYAAPQPVDMWSVLVDRCAESTRRVAAAVTTVPESLARDWMERIAQDLKKELDDVRGIAQLGRALGAVDAQHPVYQRLEAAVRDFTAFENQVATVALKMFDHPELDQVRTDLEFLEQQLPQLSG